MPQGPLQGPSTVVHISNPLSKILYPPQSISTFERLYFPMHHYICLQLWPMTMCYVAFKKSSDRASSFVSRRVSWPRTAFIIILYFILHAVFVRTNFRICLGSISFSCSTGFIFMWYLLKRHIWLTLYFIRSGIPLPPIELIMTGHIPRYIFSTLVCLYERIFFYLCYCVRFWE